MGETNDELTSPNSSENVIDGSDSDVSAADAGAQNLDENGSGSSSDTNNDEAPFDPLSVIRDARDNSADAESSTAEPDGGTAPEQDAATAEANTQEGTQAEPDNENYSDVQFHKHPRFRQLIEERNGYRDTAQKYHDVEAFLQQNGLTGDEAAQFLTLRGLMKSNPEEAWKQLRPMAQELLTQIGEILPPDLQDRVRTGALTREAALEMSRLRAQGRIATTNLETQRQQQEQQREQQRMQDAATALRTEAGTWETQQRAADPTGFDALQEDLQREIVWRHSRGDKPTDPAGVRAQLDDALTAVKQRRMATTRRKPTVVPLTGGGAGGTAPAEVNSALDVVRTARG